MFIRGIWAYVISTKISCAGSYIIKHLVFDVVCLLNCLFSFKSTRYNGYLDIFSAVQVQEGLEAGALVNWMTFYGPVKNKNLTYGILRKLPNLEERLNTAVDLTMGNTVVR